MTDKERYYDEEIAPLLRDVSEKCRDNGLSMVCAVEYNADEIGRTVLLQKDCGLGMIMVNNCIKTAPNIDSYIIGLKRYCSEKGIDTSGSIYLSKKAL